jgi:ABC-2 type transport system permease protein
MRRYFKLLRIFIANSVQLELEYRINLLMNLLNAGLSFGVGLTVLYVLFAQAESIGGWRFEEAIALFGVFLFYEGVIDLVLYPNLNKLPDHVRTGSLDFMLLKPISTQFQVSFRYASLWQVPEIFLGLGLVVYAMAALDALSLGAAALGLLLLLSGAAILYSIWFMLTTTAFWLVKVGNIPELFHAIFAAGRFPVSAFPAWIRILLTFVVPVAFITTVPAEAAIGRLDWLTGLESFGMAIVALALSRAFWRLAVRNYTSASS